MEGAGSPRHSTATAGGIGGLLMLADQSTLTTNFYAYDGNGNVMGLVKATDATKSADYEYGPFGEVIPASGALSKTNPFRFSTKCQDEETELVYYGYRFYNTSTGRWPNRDPIEERGGINLYKFVANNPLTSLDRDGRATWGPPFMLDPKCCPAAKPKVDATPYKDLADKFLTDLAGKVEEGGLASGTKQDILGKLNKFKTIYDGIRDICDAKDPPGCKEFLKKGEIDMCLLCCNSLHSLFGEQVAGIGFVFACKLACQNAN